MYGILNLHRKEHPQRHNQIINCHGPPDGPQLWPMVPGIPGAGASQNHGQVASKSPSFPCQAPSSLPSCIKLLLCEWCKTLTYLKLTSNGTK